MELEPVIQSNKVPTTSLTFTGRLNAAFQIEKLLSIWILMSLLICLTGGGI